MSTDPRTLAVPGGRTLSWVEYGAPDGSPVFFFHGFPGSHLDWQLMDRDSAAARLGVRVIAADRPGMGASTFQRGRALLHWPRDVAALADGLGIERFAVLGISGGGPYALAVAHALPDRVTAAGVVCGMGPAHAPGAKEGISWTLPGKLAPLRWALLRLTKLGLDSDPERFLESSRENMPAPDLALLDDPDFARDFTAGLAFALAGGVAGAGRDAALYARPWGFALDNIGVPVHLWHGSEDANVPLSVGEFVAESIPGCEARFVDGEGHLSMCHHLPEVLEVLRRT